MFIQTEETPNPAALKFLPGRVVMESGVMEFTSPEMAWRSPLVENLFKIPGVCRVFLGSDFITISKIEDTNWILLKPLILSTIMEYFMVHAHVHLKEIEDQCSSSSSEEDEMVVKEIKELIDTRVRPAVAQDGGNIVFDHFENGVVYLKLQGACSSCPSATATLKTGIENMLRHYIPEIQEVRAV